VHIKCIKIIISIAIYDYNFRHFGFLNTRYKNNVQSKYIYLKVLYNKLCELIINTENYNLINLIKIICDIDENPYVLFLKNLKPYYNETFNAEQNRLQLEKDAAAKANRIKPNIIEKQNITFDTEQTSLQNNADKKEDEKSNVNVINAPYTNDEIDELYTNDEDESFVHHYKPHIIVPKDGDILTESEILWNDHIMVLAQVGDSITEQDYCLLHPYYNRNIQEK
jgi:hypothetical protein